MLPIIPTALASVAAAVAAVWQTKKRRDFIANSAKNAEHINEALQRRAQATLQKERQLKIKSRMISGELHQIQQDYLEPLAIPSNFDAATINSFFKSNVDDRASVEEALTTLCGQPVRMRTIDSVEHKIQQEMQALKTLEQFIHEI